MPVLANGTYENPFYRNVSIDTRNELNARAAFYGRRTRVGTKSSEWSYKKVAWARVVSVKNKSIKLGFPGPNVMSDKDGNLTLYSSNRNVPRKPLLTGLEITNEGTMGSLLRGKFSFTVFPVLTTKGFDLGGVEEAFFKPGVEVEISWGWSVAANNNRACIQQFTGIIYNFNWQFNTDLSVTADVTIVSAATMALGQSGDQSTNKDNQGGVVDPKGVALKGNNLITVIDQDLAGVTQSTKISPGQSTFLSASSIQNGSNLLDYTGISLPFQESAVNDKAGNPVSPPVDKTYWYVKFKDVTEFANKLLTENDELGEVYTIVSNKNQAAYNPGVKSAYPLEVYFPDISMGAYGNFKPFETDSRLTKEMPTGTINIGEILIGTDFLKKTYKEFIAENSANIPFKNLTKFFESVTKRINEASGDMYQFTVILFEPREPGGKLNDTATGIGKGAESPKTIVSIEDSNLSKQHTGFTPFQFDATIFRPLIKNVSISSKPPGPLASAAFVQARGGDAKKVKPNNADVSTATKSEKDETAFKEEYNLAFEEYTKDITLDGKRGFNDAWSERVRGNLVKIKRTKIEGDDDINTPWLNKAIYPIDLSITIDGINGFKFGDVFKTSLIPYQYNEKYDMVFTVTKIQHSIKDGVWETTLSTKSRISMD